MRKVIVMTGLLCLLATGQAFARGAGTSAANFLKVAQGARPAGMAGAYVSIADGLHGLQYNPAGLAFLTPDYLDLSFEHVFSIAQVDTEILSVGQYLGETYGGGLQFLYRHMPDINNDLEDETPVKAYDFVAIVGYGVQISTLSLGVNLKFINTHLDDQDYFGEAADIGILVSFMEKKMTVGVAAQNLGPDIDLDSLPLNIRGGLSYKDLFGDRMEHAFTAAFEIDQPLDNKLALNLGIEYWYLKTFAARLGYRMQLGGDDLQTDNPMARLTGGLSVRWADLQLDYALMSYADLGLAHRLGISLHYGPLTDDVQKF